MIIAFPKGPQSTAAAMINIHQKRHLAITGRSFSIVREYFPDLVQRVGIT